MWEFMDWNHALDSAVRRMAQLDAVITQNQYGDLGKGWSLFLPHDKSYLELSALDLRELQKFVVFLEQQGIPVITTATSIRLVDDQHDRPIVEALRRYMFGT